MRLVGLSISLALTFGCAASQSSEPQLPAIGPGVEARDPDSSELSLAERAKELAQKFLIMDGHIDLPYRLEAGRDQTGALTEDVTNRTEKGDFDFVRAREGGLDVPFMSIYVPAKYQTDGGARKVADDLIDMVEAIAAGAPEKFQMVRKTSEARSILGTGKVGLALGIENGAALESKLENVDHFFNRGVRYITLTHSKDNAICDSSYDDARTHGGLTDFGKSVVTRMNKLGVMIDISHVSDPAFFDVMKLTRAPVIASHSSARHFTPGFERNMSDAMIKLVGENEGVVMINFGSTFISAKSRAHSDARRKVLRAFMAEHQLEWQDPKVQAYKDEYDAKNPFVYADVKDVADHVDHIAKIAGIETVGLGSDFDGVGDTLPTNLKDASMFPKLIEELLRRNYSEADIEKICSGNVMRVWEKVEAVARHLGGTQ